MMMESRRGLADEVEEKVKRERKRDDRDDGERVYIKNTWHILLRPQAGGRRATENPYVPLRSSVTLPCFSSDVRLAFFFFFFLLFLVLFPLLSPRKTHLDVSTLPILTISHTHPSGTKTNALHGIKSWNGTRHQILPHHPGFRTNW